MGFLFYRLRAEMYLTHLTFETIIFKSGTGKAAELPGTPVGSCK